jgi:hypothetical protein
MSSLLSSQRCSALSCSFAAGEMEVGEDLSRCPDGFIVGGTMCLPFFHLSSFLLGVYFADPCSDTNRRGYDILYLGISCAWRDMLPRTHRKVTVSPVSCVEPI